MSFLQNSEDGQSTVKLDQDFTISQNGVVLDGWSAEYNIFIASVQLYVKSIKMVYEADVSIDETNVGVSLALGTYQHPCKIAGWSSAKTASRGDVKDVRVSSGNNILQPGETLVLYVGVGAQGAGQVGVQVVLSKVI